MEEITRTTADGHNPACDLLSAFNCAVHQPTYRDAIAYIDKWRTGEPISDDVYKHIDLLLSRHYA